MNLTDWDRASALVLVVTAVIDRRRSLRPRLADWLATLSLPSTPVALWTHGSSITTTSTTSRTGTHTPAHQVSLSTLVDRVDLSTQRRRNKPRRCRCPCYCRSN